MTPHAHLALQIAQLPKLPMAQLWALWDSHFEARPNHHHRTWLEGRLAYKIQELALGGLKPALRRKLQLIGETGLLPKGLQRDSDQLLPGTVLTRTFDDVEHRVTVRGLRDFEYQGRRFTSLSAVARVIAGCPWSGPLFFGLKPAQNKREAA
jgi:Protein of unknown function (DUF2924)